MLVRLALPVALALLASGAAPHASAQVQSELVRGPYAVGFSSTQQRDHARAFTRADGRVESRPVQLWTWFPAAEAADAQGERLTLRAYAELAAYRADPSRERADAPARDLDEIENALRGITTREQIERLYDQPTWARRDAQVAAGRFPVVIYGCGAPAAPSGNAPLFELLASHGYVVVSVPYNGIVEGEAREDLPLMLATRDDMAFALGHALTQSFVDPERVAACGFSWGGWAATWLALRDPRVDALVLLDPYPGMRQPWIEAALHAGRPRESLALSSTPMLEFVAGKKALSLPADPFELRKANSISALAPYAAAELVQLVDMDHLGFSAFNLDLHDAGHTGASPRREALRLAYALTLAFLDAHFAPGDAQVAPDADTLIAAHDMQARAVRESRGATPTPPRADAFARLVREEGTSTAREVFRAARAKAPGVVLFGEREVSQVAIELYSRGEVEQAVDALRLQIEGYPSFLRNYQDLAYVFEQSGQPDAMLAVCEQMLELDPGNAWAQRRLDAR